MIGHLHAVVRKLNWPSVLRTYNGAFLMANGRCRRSSLVPRPLSVSVVHRRSSVLACALFRIYLNEPERINTATLDAINGLSISTHRGKVKIRLRDRVR